MENTNLTLRTPQKTALPGEAHLSKRLSRLAELISPCRRIVDIGCDHGRLDLYMLLSGNAEKALMTDLHEGPYRRAGEMIKRHGLENRAELLRCDGLGDHQLEEGDRLVIAGLGGLEICSILTRLSFPQDFSAVFQPNWNQAALRTHLASRGWSFEEEILEDRGWFYLFIRLRSPSKPRELSLIEAEIGSYWLKRGEKQFTETERAYFKRQRRLFQMKARKFPEFTAVARQLAELPAMR